MYSMWKQTFPAHPGIYDFEAPRYAHVVSVGAQNGAVAVWLWVDTTQPKTARRVALVETGGSCPSFEQGQFRGTVLLLGGSYVLHVFEPL
jgi:hypothetical protein